MQEITQPLADLPRDPVAAVASVDFPIVLRGYDREAVDEYVRRTTQLVAELYATRSPEGAVRRALERVGEQVSSILARAHETAEGITSQSRAEAEERLMQARTEAQELERDAHELAQQLESEAERKAQERERVADARVHELDAEVDRIWAERDRIVSDVRRLSEQLGEIAGIAASHFPAATTEEAAAVAAPAGAEATAAPEKADVPEHKPEAEHESAAEQEPAIEQEPEAEQAPAAEQEPAIEREPEAFTEPLSDAGPEPNFDDLESPEEELAEKAAPEQDLGAETEAELEAAAAQQGLGAESGMDLREVPADVDEDPVTPIEPSPLVGGVLPGPPVFTVPEPGSGPEEAEQPTRVYQRPRMRVIDLHHLGRERVIGCWQVDDVLIDPGPASCLQTLLAAVEGKPRAVLLTHIHLDHAGAAGSLVRRWPDLEVYVHERGAAHLIDPTRLLDSARRLYGDDMERLWGEVVPVPEANLRILGGGERLLGDRFEVAYTPGHASHHVSYLFERTAFVGDVGGVRITPETLTIPPTPPPDIDIEAWDASIERVLEWEPDRLAMTHFGLSEDVQDQLAEVAERLDTWAALVRTEDLRSFVETVEGEIERGSAPAHRGAYTQAAPPEQLYAGLERYWQKREGGSSDGSTTEEVPAVEQPEQGPLGSAAEASTHAGRTAQASRWIPPSG